VLYDGSRGVQIELFFFFSSLVASVTRAMSRLQSLWSAPALWGILIRPCEDSMFCTDDSERS